VLWRQSKEPPEDRVLPSLNPTITTGASFEQSKGFQWLDNSGGWGFGTGGTDRQHCNKLLQAQAASVRAVKLLYCQTCL